MLVLAGLALAVWAGSAFLRSRRARASARRAAIDALERELVATKADVDGLVEASLANARRLHAVARQRASQVVAGFSIVTAVAELNTSIERYRRTGRDAEDLYRARQIESEAKALAGEASEQHAQRTGRVLKFAGLWWFSRGGDFE